MIAHAPGEMPPYAAVLGLSVEPDAEGRPVIAMPFADDVVGRPGMLHGGAIAGLLEIAALAALDMALGRDSAVTFKPVNASIEFLRGGRDRTTRATGEVTRLGRRVANVTATAWQDDRAKPIAAARLTFLLARPEEDGEAGRTPG